MYGVLATTYYKTSLTGTLAVPFTPPNINTLLELLSSDLKYGMNEAKVHDIMFSRVRGIEFFIRVLIKKFIDRIFHCNTYFHS